jgi:microcystin-dependent protein
MAIGQRYYTPNQFEVDGNGVPLSGGQLFFYATGTTTPQATYQDVALTVPNANPVIADAGGRFGSIFLSPSNAYAVALWTAATTDNPTGSEVWTMDPVGPAAGGAQTSVLGIIGEIRAFAGLASGVPAAWYLCYGQAVSRTTYAAAFAVLGTAWGSGDGTTTFNLPDLRGTAMAGLDNMGGTPANRMTAGVSGIAGTTLGASGGSQATQDHNHTVSDPEHTHALTDPSHDHSLANVIAGSTGADPGFGSGALYNPTSPIELTGTATTGISISSAATGISLATYGAGGSQNVQPTAMVNMITYLGL